MRHTDWHFQSITIITRLVTTEKSQLFTLKVRTGSYLSLKMCPCYDDAPKKFSVKFSVLFFWLQSLKSILKPSTQNPICHQFDPRIWTFRFCWDLYGDDPTQSFEASSFNNSRELDRKIASKCTVQFTFTWNLELVSDTNNVTRKIIGFWWSYLANSI